MSPKKKSQRAGKTRQEETSKRTHCPECGEEIVIPTVCKHGKKLSNCHGTECSLPPLTVHKKTCQGEALKMAVRAAIRAEQDANLERETFVRLAMAELQNAEKGRGKQVQYLHGIPRAELLNKINEISLKDLQEVARQIKCFAEGALTASEAMYDDDDTSEDDAGAPTPLEDETEIDEFPTPRSAQEEDRTGPH